MEGQIAVVVDHDPAWAATAARLLAELAAVGEPSWVYEHIGSTAVPGLAAKPIVDLQVRVPELPGSERLDALLAPLGYGRATGARPDSPGVTRDSRFPGDDVPDAALQKRLYVHPDAPAAILHVRRVDSPFAEATVLLRDWMRAHPDDRDAYARLKRELADTHRDDPDYDDYTRGKTEFVRCIVERARAAR